MSARRDLEGKVSLVTGGSGGIGASTARRLAEAGSRVVVAYHSNLEKARDLVASLPGDGHAVARLAIDDADSIADLKRLVEARWSRLDVLVNAAGFTKPIPHRDLDALSDEFMDAIFATNVRGPFALVRAFARLLRASGAGVIINVSSISGFTGSGSNIAYCAAKGALDTMTLSLARALGPEIRVLAVSPGAVATDFVEGRDRDALEKLAQATPLRRVIEPDDVALAVMAGVTHLPASTGGRLIVDGGRLLV